MLKDDPLDKSALIEQGRLVPCELRGLGTNISIFSTGFVGGATTRWQKAIFLAIPSALSIAAFLGEKSILNQLDKFTNN